MSRVLIVDDDPVIRRLLEVNFRLEGFAVETADGGEAALASARADRPDAVVLDLTMPNIDGFEVCRRLHSEADGEQIAVVIVSARSSEGDREEASLAGATAYMTKPFDPADLVRTIREAIEAPGDGDRSGSAP